MNYCKLIFSSISATLFVFALSCSEDPKLKIRKLKIDDSTIVMGAISEDTIFNGNMKFYNLNGMLLSECEYRDGILNGIRKEYFLNGHLSAVTNYSNGLLHGKARFYDKDGNLMEVRNFYYGLNVGESISLLNGRANKYTFYSLDFEPIFQLEYDPNHRREITSLEESYFFFRRDTFSSLNSINYDAKKTSIFLYLPSPPLYDFNYSLVYTDNKLKVISRIRSLKSDKPWIDFILEDYPVSQGKKLAIELNLKDSIYGGETSMLKVINEFKDN